MSWRAKERGPVKLNGKVTLNTSWGSWYVLSALGHTRCKSRKGLFLIFAYPAPRVVKHVVGGQQMFIGGMSDLEFYLLAWRSS